jgi:hypothetical protein
MSIKGNNLSVLNFNKIVLSVLLDICKLQIIWKFYALIIGNLLWVAFMESLIYTELWIYLMIIIVVIKRAKWFCIVSYGIISSFPFSQWIHLKQWPEKADIPSWEGIQFRNVSLRNYILSQETQMPFNTTHK